MQYRRALSILSLVVLASPAVARAVDAEQPGTVTRLQSFGTLVSFLNLASGTVRVVVVLEPSSPSTGQMLDAVRSVLASNPSKRLRAYVVWSHAGPADTEVRALTASTTVRDRRLVYFWDSGTQVADYFRGALGQPGATATGVVLLYDTDARLSMTPPAPSIWMSVNPRVAGAPLDAAALGAHANEMVRRVEAKIADASQPKP